MSINHNYKVCDEPIICTDSIKVLGILLHSQTFYHHHVDCVCSQSLKILGLVHMLTYSCLLLTLYYCYILRSYI